MLRTATPEGIEVVLSALVYAKILEKHRDVADLSLIARIIAEPVRRTPDSLPWRERFIGGPRRQRTLAVVDYQPLPAIILTVFEIGQAR